MKRKRIMMSRKLLYIIIFLPAICLAQYDRPGSTDAQFVKIGVSPRGTAMSDAFIAVVNGAESMYYNASAMPWTKGTDVVFNHTRWFAGINHEFFAVSHNAGDMGSFGLSATALMTDVMDVTTPLQPDGTGETFVAGNYKFTAGYARFLTDRVTIGVTAGYIHMKLYQSFTVDAFSVDISTMYVSDFRGFRFGMQISNFGSNLQYVNEPYPLPTCFTFGMAMNAIQEEKTKLIVSIAVSKPNEGQPLAQAGAELNFSDFLFLRGGYRINHSVATYSFGGGVRLNVEIPIRLDYSYCDYQTLGVVHRVGIGIEL